MISSLPKILSILKNPIDANNDSIYDYSDHSETQEYFLKFASGTGSDVRDTEGFKELLERTSTPRSTAVMTGIVQRLKNLLSHDSIVVEIGGGSEGQTRSGKGYLAFRNYYPLDISYPHIKAYTTAYGRTGIVCNAERLPFKDNSVDCIYTNAFLEHPINPSNVVAEIARVIKPGGIVIHNDAWFCRWWQCHGVHKVLKWREMNAKQKLIDITATISEIKILRLPPIIIRRAFKHLINKKDNSLSFRKLSPNYNLYLGCDEDAAACIDPVDAIRFYEHAGFDLITPLTFKQRLFYPNKFIALRKRA